VFALGGGRTTPKSHEGSSVTPRPGGLEVVEPPPWSMGGGLATHDKKIKNKNKGFWALGAVEPALRPKTL